MTEKYDQKYVALFIDNIEVKLGDGDIMKDIKDDFKTLEVTHIGTTESGVELKLRKNKLGQWCTLRNSKKGLYWGGINLLYEFPVVVREVKGVKDIEVKFEVIK